MTNHQAPMTNTGPSVDHAIEFLPADRLRKRLLKWLRPQAALTFTVAIAMSGRAGAQLESRLAVMRAAGDPASIADLAPAPIPDDKNAAVYLERIGPRLSEFSRDHARFTNTPLGQAYEEGQDRGEPATPEQLFEMRLILINYEDIDEALVQAAKCDRYVSRLDYSRLFTDFVEAAIKTQGNIRTAGRFVNWRMEVLIADGFPEDALEYGLRMLRLARLYESEPTIVPFLVGISVRSLTAPQFMMR